MARTILADYQVGHALDTNNPHNVTASQLNTNTKLTTDLTVTVGSGGDYETINAALEDIVAKYYPTYKSGGNCPRVTINLLSGFVMSEQVLVESLDLSWITITGDDAETVIDRSALVTEFAGRYPAFSIINGGCLPIIGQLFNMSTAGTDTKRDGIRAIGNASVIVASGCGVKNAGQHGIFLEQSCRGNLVEGVFSGASSRGINVATNSFAYAGYVDVTNCGDNGIISQYGSFVSAIYADATGSGGYGFRVSVGGIIAAQGATGTLSQSVNSITLNGIIFQ